MKRLATYAAALLATAPMHSCIENDIPYPVVECRIESIAAEGLAGAPSIDYNRGRVTLPLLETTDIRNVEITDVEITEDAVASRELKGRFDLRAPLYVTLSLYQDYQWSIEAEQTIERYFTVEGQIGSAEWNIADRTATVYVGFEDRSDITITSLKLGPEGITSMSCTDIPDFNDSNLTLLRDFTTPRRIDVTCHGRTETWYIAVEYTDVKVNFTGIDGWARSAWLYAEGLSGSELGFRYRRAGSEEWTTADPASITVDGGAFRARIRGLEPESEYEAVAYSDDDISAVERFRTEAELPLPNCGFEEWSMPGKIVYPYLSEQSAYWDSGNKGSSTVNETICEGSPDIRPGSDGKTSAYLCSKFASVVGIGKFAAGNIFVGTYHETVGTNGKVNFGRPFASRPSALSGWVKYTQGKIDRIDRQPDGMTLTTEDFDQGSIYVALGTWTAAEYGGTDQSPVQVFTKEPSTYFDKNAKDVVAYGELMLNETVGEWRRFTIELDYTTTSVVPTHLIIVCSASRWGDYFTGSTQSRMWLDDFELVWD
ncbi:MAG: PCMD domain-containing protein [Alistipes sp.]|nr:PCMD domain-containing protein [Alistipes sp.]